MDSVNDKIEKEITNLFEKTLDFVQVICPNDYTYKQIRSKILRAGNDCIRNCDKILE